MAQFLGLVNAVCRRMNEVELTSTNFASVRGFHAFVKDSVNSALRDIDQAGGEWSFNWATTDVVLTPSLGRYPRPADTRRIDFESFRLIANPSLGIGSTTWIAPVAYDQVLQERDYEEDAPVDSATPGVPFAVAPARDGGFLLSPRPDKAYTVRFERYAHPAELVDHDDEAAIPSPWWPIAVDQACYHCHIFRADPESAALARAAYERGLKEMRRDLQPQPDRMRPTLSGIRNYLRHQVR